MTPPRILAGFALLLAAGTAACAQVVPGNGSLAADERTGSSPTGSTSPSSTDESTGSPASGSSASADSTNPVCESLDRDALQQAFGAPVTLSRSQSSGCQIRAEDGRSMIVAVFDYLTLAEYKKPDTTDLSVGGHPALRTTTTIIYVGRSLDPTGEGLLAAYFSGLRDGGEAIAVKVLEQLVKKYPK
ncbi:MAG TPA: DUF3558 family protein, partial [Mycobacteriales bacterium]|nr:DUF3558 family protein [Mycobacteriales bacterium]